MWFCICDLVTGKILCEFVKVIFFVLLEEGEFSCQSCLKGLV